MSLAWAAAEFRHAAPSLYYAPQLWGTTDGVIAFRRFWFEYYCLGSHLARVQHMTAAAHRLGLGGEDVDTDRAKVRAAGWPTFKGD